MKVSIRSLYSNSHIPFITDLLTGRSITAHRVTRTCLDVRFLLDPFTSDKKKTGKGMKQLISIRLDHDLLTYNILSRNAKLDL